MARELFGLAQRTCRQEIYLRNFIITLAVSIGGTIVFWSFGLARFIWPAHPMLATSLIIGLIAIVLPSLLADHTQTERPKTLPAKKI